VKLNEDLKVEKRIKISGTPRNHHFKFGLVREVSERDFLTINV
jgi:hypothetical protein